MTQHLDIAVRMKGYEEPATSQRFLAGMPVVARLDGRAFHTLTRKLQKPFDPALVAAMRAVTKRLVQQSGAWVGYTQSDESTLVWKEHPFMDGRAFKMVSLLASMAGSFFMYECSQTMPALVEKFPIFDCRVFAVPSLDEAANVLVWREIDAKRNSVVSLAQSIFSHKSLRKKGVPEVLALLAEKGTIWEKLPAHLKYGSWYGRSPLVTTMPLEGELLSRLPPKHHAHQWVKEGAQEMCVCRSLVEERHIAPIQKVQNKVDVIFEGAEPIRNDPEKIDCLQG